MFWNTIHMFQVTEKRWYWLKAFALATIRDWDALEKFSKERKPHNPPGLCYMLLFSLYIYIFCYLGLISTIFTSVLRSRCILYVANDTCFACTTKKHFKVQSTPKLSDELVPFFHLGYRPFVDACVDAGEKDEALKYIPKLNDPRERAEVTTIHH